jgi:hypothetical protein
MKNIENNINFVPLDQDDQKTINGGEPITLAVGIACGILFVGSVALGFAIGSRIWK